MSVSSSAAFAQVSSSIGLDQDRVLGLIRSQFPEGATQQQVFEALVEGKEMEKSALGSLFQQTSRILSTADKDGFLDGSETVSSGKSTRTLYRIPTVRLKPRKTRMELAKEEIEELTLKLRSQTSRADFLALNNQLLRDQLVALGVKPV
jgi:hypothetical protein